MFKITSIAKICAKTGCPALYNDKVANPNIINSSNNLLIPRIGIGALGDTNVPQIIAIKRGEPIPNKILTIYPLSE